MIANVTRLYSDANGESRFEDSNIELNLTNYVITGPPLHLSNPFPASSFSYFDAPAGWQSDWHASKSRNLFIVISGTWEVTTSDGETRTFAKGCVLLVEDTTGKGHSSRVVSAEDSLAVMIQL
jgi:quercetin dioxygenase-like cupin family protein